MWDEDKKAWVNLNQDDEVSTKALSLVVVVVVVVVCMTCNWAC